MNQEITQTNSATPDELQAIFSMNTEEAFSDRQLNIRRHPVTGRIISGHDGSDELLNVHFTVEPVLNKLQTLRCGAPTYVDMEFVTISAPGMDQRTVVHTPVTEFHKWRFPVDYKTFVDGNGALLSGTPLSVWTHLSPSQIKGLEHNGIRTVNQLAQLPDSAASGMLALKAKAQEFLDTLKSTTKASELQDELQKRDDQLAAMQAQMEELKSMLINSNNNKKAAAKTADQ